MKNLYILTLVCIFDIGIITAQSLKSTIKQHLIEIDAEFDRNRAFETTKYVGARWRLPGNKGYNESIYRIEEELIAAGYTKDGKDELSYRIEQYPLRTPAWNPISGTLMLGKGNSKVLEFSSNLNMIAINSFSTKGEIIAQIVEIEACNESALEGIDVKGKIVMAKCHSYSLYKLAIEKHGALGILSYNIPSFNQPEKFQNSIPFSRIPYNNELQGWAINLSNNAYNILRKSIETGNSTVKVDIKTEFTPGDELAILAEIKGSEEPDSRFVFSAHVQEPGTNDNATGVGTLTEMARATASLFKKNKINPLRTITFLWGDEIRSTRRYIVQDSIRAKGIKWGMSLDMVGENTTITGGTFLIEKMPDPSAIWTRGKDKHTEWGAGRVTQENFNPHYFNDYVEYVCRLQAKRSKWTVNTNPFEGGSDHQPFLDADIPGLLLWHFTDVFYHTDADRIDKVSPETLENVGISALAGAIFLAQCKDTDINPLADLVYKAARKRMQREIALSKKNIRNGSSSKKEETIILDAWMDWYNGSIKSTRDVSISNQYLGSQIQALNTKLNKKYSKKISSL